MEEIEEVREYKYLGQTLSTTDTIDIEIATRIRTTWSCFSKYRDIFLYNDVPMCLKKKVFEQCIKLTLNDCETSWSLKINTVQRYDQPRELWKEKY